MSVQANRMNIEALTAGGSAVPDKSCWTELQHLQYTLGIWDGSEGSPVRHRELPEWTWVPNEDWRSLGGALRDDPERSTTELKAEERAWEQAHDAWKFGPFPER